MRDDVFTMRPILIVVLACCGTPPSARPMTDARSEDDAADAAGDAKTSEDAAVDGPLFGPWNAPISAGLPADADDPTLTADGLELYLNLSGDIYTSTRAALDQAWPTPTKVLALSAAAFESTPEVSPDGLTLYFSSSRMPTVGMQDIWMSSRADRASAWGTPVHVLELSTAGNDSAPTTVDGVTMVLCSNPGTASRIYEATRASPQAAWSTPVEITALTSGVGECDPMLSSDGLTLYYFTLASGQGDIFVTTRATTSDAFAVGQSIDNIDLMTEFDADPFVTSDGRHMLFESSRDGAYGIWEASR
jgi:Tol biopolymer transport system component